MSKVYEIITDRICAEIEKSGQLPWEQDWSSGCKMPINLVSNKPYRGINVFMLFMQRYSSPYWLTFKQAQSLGGTVRKGEKGTPVVFFSMLEGKEKPTTAANSPSVANRFACLRYYTVFNASQCADIELPTDGQAIRAIEPIPACESILNAYKDKPEIKSGFGHCFYHPASDYVGMPAQSAFKSDESYYSVLFHELIHSTGHEKRLNRKELVHNEMFGSQTYSKEELTAEFGAAFLNAQAGIDGKTERNNTAYIAGWLKYIKEDPKALVSAAGKAQKAADYILGKTWDADKE